MPNQGSLIIRGGQVADGSGAEPRAADILVEGGRIAAVGKITASADDEIDARGLLVTPGFVDVHTHYDAQVTWSDRITPSSWNGVTTAVIGNCGVGFAPCRPEQRDVLVDLMAGVEDIPVEVLHAGLPWTWQTFPEFMDMLAARRFDLDVVAQVPHAAVRAYVMGERGANQEPATARDRQVMMQVVAEGIRAGALGFSTSRAANHKGVSGRTTFALTADEDELGAIADGMRAAGTGWLQVIADFNEKLDTEFDMLRRLVKRSGRPMTISVLERETKPQEWRNLLDRIAQANADGLAISGQVSCRAVGILLGLEISENPFMACPTYEAMAERPLAERLQALRRPDIRARILAEEFADPVLSRRVRTWSRLFQLDDSPDYEPPASASVEARAAQMGVVPAALAYDLLLERDGRNILYRPFSNYAHGDLETVRQMLNDPNAIHGLGDGGAHVAHLCDASTTTYMLSHWTRDRTRGSRLPLGFAVNRLTRRNAEAIGLFDRGLIAPGYKADLNVIDYDKLALHRPEVVYDLPEGGQRLVQTCGGYVATIVAGKVVYREGRPTGALSGRLVRGPQQPT